MLESIDIPMPNATCEAWLARPEGSGPWPGVIFCMDAVGPRATLFAMAERLASAGYVVLLPNFFYRLKPTPIVHDVDFPARSEDLPAILAQIMPIVERFDPSQAISDVDVFIKFLRQQPGVRAEGMGIFGYCMGGAMALRAAASYPQIFTAVASFHAGGLLGNESLSPSSLLPRIQASVYVGHADQDPHMTAAQIRAFDSAAKACLHGRYTSEVYTGAAHHFTMPDLPAYNASAAEKHWQRLMECLAKIK